MGRKNVAIHLYLGYSNIRSKTWHGRMGSLGVKNDASLHNRHDPVWPGPGQQQPGRAFYSANKSANFSSSDAVSYLIRKCKGVDCR